MRIVSVIILILISSFTFAQKNYRNTAEGVIVSVKDSVKNGAKLIRIEPVTEKIFRISAVSSEVFPNSNSLIIQKKFFPKVNFLVQENSDTLVIKTSALSARVSLKSGGIIFCDSTGNPILSELKGGGRSIEPVTLENEHLFRIHQQFESPSNEAFYGLGQQQEGIFNYKDEDVDLYQYNTKISIPFVISNRNYGILWDNYSRSKFGDIRDYDSLSCLKLFDSDGKEGSLSAKYFNTKDDSKIFLSRNESQIDYEFIPLLKNLPSGFSLENGKAEWNGSIEPVKNGRYKFRLYSSGFCKLWIDDKLIVDRWRQSWNAFVYLFNLDLKIGHKYPIRIEWIPDGSQAFISLKVKTPLPEEEQDRLSLYSEYGKQIDYYFITGKNMDEVISGYRQLTGKAEIPPKWAFGFWQSRERYKTQNELLQVAREYRKLKIPFDNIVQDWFYWKEEQWGSQSFDSSRYPNPKSMVDELHNMLHEHFMISVWPKFYEGIKNFNLMNEKGFLYQGNLKLKNKDWVGPGYLSTFYDAYNSAARKLFWKMIDKNLYPIGIDAWWLDASEPDICSNLPMDTRKYLMDPTALGPGAEYFNAYSLENSRAIYEGQMAVNPNKRVFILTRSAFAGQQRYDAAVWSGDIASTWQDMKGQIPAGLNYSMSGLPYWTFDIGGFAVPNKFIDANGENLAEWSELLTRWYEFGAFCPLYRSHGQYPYREIFNVSPEGSADYNAMVGVTKLRYRLMPYIYSLAGLVYLKDYTIMRALIMDFSNDEKVENISDEYMFGPALLVAPVTKFKARTKDVYLPAGYGWFDLYTGKFYEGGKTIKVESPIDKIPLFIKEGSIIPVGKEIQYAEQEQNTDLTLYIYKGKDASFILYEDENENNNYKNGKYVMIAMNYNESTGKLTIDAPKGVYKGMPSKRKFRIVWIDKNNPVPFLSKIPNEQVVDYLNKKLILTEIK